MIEPYSEEPISAEIVSEEPISAELVSDNPRVLKRKRRIRFRFGLLVPVVIFCGAIGALIFFCISTYYGIEAGTHGISEQLAGVWVLEYEDVIVDRVSGKAKAVRNSKDPDTEDPDTEDKAPDLDAKKTAKRSSINEFMKDVDDVYMGLQHYPQLSIDSDGSGVIEFDWKYVRGDAEGTWSIMRVHDETIVLSFQLSFEETQLQNEETLAGPVLLSIEMEGDDFFVVTEVVVPGQPAVVVEPPLRFKRISE